MSAHLHVVILAAGASTRLGQPKQLVPIAGRPALQHVVSNAIAVAGAAVTVVLGSQAAEITRLLQHSSASVSINRHWEEGMASSIRHGLSSVGGSDAVLLLLGDQVAVSAADLRRLIAAWNGQDSIIAASVYSGQLGVPAIFPRFAFSELMQLRGDQGAKAILNHYSSRLTHVPMPNAAYDLDTLEDVAAAQEALRGREKDVLL
ncbi:MAG: nucleotidyltransferase family protein [Steroidobacteraceae bacterium]